MRARDYRLAPKISWQQILASLEDGVVMLDPESRITAFNESAETLTELPASQALGQPVATVFRSEPWLVEVARKSAPPHHESVRTEGEVVTRSGRKVAVAATASPLQDNHGSFLGSILLLRDVTHRKELEEDLKRADRMAAMGMFAAGLAHEIRNPLGGIKGAAQLLRRAVERDPALREYTEIMIREVDRVDKLIDQLLDLSRPAAVDLAPLNIHEVLEEVLLLEAQEAAERGIAVQKRFDPSLPPILGDRAQLTQVFLNLIKNAFQATQKNGTVTITTRVETDFHIRGRGAGRSRFIWVDVEDRGVGIKEEDLPHIFSPFFTTKTSGTGLGLAICYRIVKEHGGLIRVESVEGKGSVFKVSLVVAS
ncbi:MAG TPA: ATP-binding protein [candidate division Zixibacteria bacterium]|nr:ATP-binding protein [candidate division Zixibacteria bacterium]